MWLVVGLKTLHHSTHSVAVAATNMLWGGRIEIDVDMQSHKHGKEWMSFHVELDSLYTSTSKTPRSEDRILKLFYIKFIHISNSV